MLSPLRARVSFAWTSTKTRVWALIQTTWLIVSNAAQIRDFLPDAAKQGLPSTPHWPWWVWLIGSLVLLLCAVIDAAFRRFMASEAQAERERQRAEEEKRRADEVIKSYSQSLGWDRAIKAFEDLVAYDIEACLERKTRFEKTTDHWSFHLFGSGDDHDAVVRACDTACRLAGHCLVQSKAWSTVNDEVKRHDDPLEIWLRFVVSKDGFGGFTGRTTDNLYEVGMTSTSDNIRHLPKKSKGLCEVVRNSEAFL